MTTVRCAIYSRYSTDLQSPTSIEDQIRKCSDYADGKGWVILPEHCYADRAVSGSGIDRAAFMQLMNASQSFPRPFDVLLVDDTSRLSRSTADALRTYETLRFLGIRTVAVSQSIDSHDEQSEVLVTVHGLVDSLYIKELAKKTHRGLEGRVLRGLHAGGRCFGYRTVAVEGGKRLEVDPGEAHIVRRVFEMSSSGLSLRRIAKTLNAEGVQAPRLRAGKQHGGWCPSAIREMLYNERYRGRLIWNRTWKVRAPGTNKKVQRKREAGEWQIMERPDLRIVTEELWEGVRRRLEWVKAHYKGVAQQGLLHRSASSQNLLTGFLTCGTCGGRMTIVTGRSGGRYPRYGCPRAHNRGTCTNPLTQRRDELEDRLFAELQHEILKPDAIEYALQDFQKQLAMRVQDLSGRSAQMHATKAQLEVEITRLVKAVAEQGSAGRHRRNASFCNRAVVRTWVNCFARMSQSLRRNWRSTLNKSAWNPTQPGDVTRSAVNGI